MDEPTGEVGSYRAVAVGNTAAQVSQLSIQQLLEQIIAAARCSTEPASAVRTPPGRTCSPENDRRVVLDAAIGDVRYVLIRLPTSATSGERLGASTLSPRELEIARMVAKGLTNKSIARVLDISLWTVSTHLRRIFAKLGVASRAAMVARVLEEDTLLNGYVEAFDAHVIDMHDDIGWTHQSGLQP